MILSRRAHGLPCDPFCHVDLEQRVARFSFLYMHAHYVLALKMVLCITINNEFHYYQLLFDAFFLSFRWPRAHLMTSCELSGSDLKI